MSERRLHRPTVVSMIVSVVLIFLGVVRCLSYLRDPLIGDRVRGDLILAECVSAQRCSYHATDFDGDGRVEVFTIERVIALDGPRSPIGRVFHMGE